MRFLQGFSFLFAAKRELALWRRVDRRVNRILSTEGLMIKRTTLKHMKVEIFFVKNAGI